MSARGDGGCLTRGGRGNGGIRAETHLDPTRGRTPRAAGPRANRDRQPHGSLQSTSVTTAVSNVAAGNGS